MKRLILILFFVVLSALIFFSSANGMPTSDTYNFTGRLTNKTGSPVNATVSVGSLSNHTDSDGNYSLQIEPGIYDIQYNIDKFAVPNFYVRLSSVNISSDLRDLVSNVSQYSPQNNKYNVSFSFDDSISKIAQTYSSTKPNRVIINGTISTEASSLSQLAEHAWFYNSTENMLYVNSTYAQPTQQTCSDDTSYGNCSSNKPKYCNNGNLVDNCTYCGCSSGQNCNTTSNSCYTPSTNSGLLHTNGTKILNVNNEEVVFHGIFGYAFYGAYYPSVEAKHILTYSDIDNIRNHGMNHIRLSVPLGYLFHDQPIPSSPQTITYNQQFFTELDAIVDYAAQKGIWVAINNHGGDYLSGYFESDYREFLPWWAFDGTWSLQPYKYPATRPDGQNQALYDFWNLDDPKLESVRQLYLQMWKDIGAHYKDRGNVIFTFWNEPFMDKTIWGSNLTHGAQHYKDFNERTIDAIRQGDINNHIVSINSGYFYYNGGHPEMNQQYPVNRSNVIYEQHFYDNFFYGKVVHDVVLKYANYAWLSNPPRPFYIGEYGLMDGGGNPGEPMGDNTTAEFLHQSYGGLGQQIGTTYFNYESDPNHGDRRIQPSLNPGTQSHQTGSVIGNAVWYGTYGSYSWNVLDANMPPNLKYYS